MTHSSDLIETAHDPILSPHLQNMPVLQFMNTFADWEARITQPPFRITVKHDGVYTLLQYQQLNSDMKIRLVQEARGSIFRQNESGEWQYVCRPFDKFFNHGQAEADQIDWSTARILEKVDGSLMKLWNDNGRWHLSTNGTIDAFKAPVSDLGYSYGDVFNRALGADFAALGTCLDPNYTYMFELTSPDTQLIVPYADGVWYLSRRHTQSGIEEFDRPDLPGVKLPKQFLMNNLTDVLEVVSQMPKDEEGVVVNDAHSKRVKIKSPEYLMAAHLANNKMISNRNLVIYMQEDKLDDFLAYCPQHAARVQDLLDRFHAKCTELEAAWEKHKACAQLPRREFAAMVAKNPYRPYLFAKLQSPEMSADKFLLRQQTSALMRMLDLKADII